MAINDLISGLSRRDFLRMTSYGFGGACLSGWMNVLASRAAETGAKTKSCILLWMDGGPSHKDTFDLKPGTKDAGEFKPIKTNVPGIEISEHFPKLGKLMNHVAIIRSMTTGEGAHARAKYFMHTGYREGVGGLTYPSIGAIASQELGRKDFPLPNFVTIGNRSYGAGFLGAKHQPIIIADPARGVENLRPLVSEPNFEKRVDLLAEMESAFFRDYQAGTATDHRTTYERAVTLMKAKEGKAFDLSVESDATKSSYGGTKFGEGCLMARKLVEVGVPFVEVSLGGWDTHQDNWTRVKSLSGTVDPAISQLIADLKQRGLLDSTLVVWMGEFGRTPKINSRGAKPGRDHYPRAWSLVMAGGGLRTGQVIGKTDAEGASVADRPVSGLDFLSTVCATLGINYTRSNNTPNGRPVRIVDKGATPIKELVG
jgi:hypothetical protein